MKQKSVFLLAITVIGVLFATAFNVALGAGVGFTAICAVGQNHFSKATSTSLFDGLFPEVWTTDVMDGFFPDTSFLTEAQDFSEFVNADAINMREAGADPSVLKNNTTYPITTEADAEETPLRKVLDYYDTTTTVIRNAVETELNYNQRQLYTDKHKRVLLQKIGNDAANQFAPVQNSTFNKVIDATGDGAGEILDRIIELQTAYNNMDAPLEGRILVLNPNHIGIIAKEDKALFKTFEASPGKMLFGFKVYSYSKNPFYIKSTGVKAAQGVAFNGSLHAAASFSFMKTEVMRATGTITMFSKMKDPELKGDAFNFQLRAYVDRIRAKYAGAIFK